MIFQMKNVQTLLLVFLRDDSEGRIYANDLCEPELVCAESGYGQTG